MQEITDNINAELLKSTKKPTNSYKAQLLKKIRGVGKSQQ